MDAEFDLIVAALKRERKFIILFIMLCLVGAVWPAIDVIQGREWGFGIVSLLYGGVAFYAWRSFAREGVFHPERSPLLHALTERPGDVVWVQYKAEAIEPSQLSSWRSRAKASWRNARIKVHLVDNRSFPLVSTNEEARALLHILQERVPHADFGDSKEMKERYEARVKAWKEAQSAADASG